MSKYGVVLAYMVASALFFGAGFGFIAGMIDGCERHWTRFAHAVPTYIAGCYAGAYMMERP